MDTGHEIYAPTDDEVLQKIRSNMINASLFDGDTSRFNDAERTMLRALSIHCNYDRVQIERIYRKSALCDDSWDERSEPDGPTRGQKLIEEVCAGHRPLTVAQVENDRRECEMRRSLSAFPFPDIPSAQAEEKRPKREVLPPPSPPPLHVFPRAIQDAIREIAEATSTEPTISVATLLGLMGMVLNGRYAVKVREDYVVPLNLFVILVASSGSGKGPAEEIFFERVKEKQDDQNNDFLDQMKDYRRALAEYKRESKNSKGGALPDEPEKPVRRRVFLQEGTLEGYVDALKNHPQGLGLLSHEFSGTLGERGRFANGSAKGMLALYNKAYDGSRYESDTRTSESPVIPHMRLSIFAQVQPDLFRSTMTADDVLSGFSARCSCFRSEDTKPPVFSFDACVTEKSRDLIRGIVDMYDPSAPPNLDAKGNVLPTCFVLSEDGKPLFAEWMNRTLERGFYDPDKNRDWSTFRKLCGLQAPKFIGILHCLRAAAGEESLDAPIPPQTVRDGIELADFVLQNNRQVLRLLTCRKLELEDGAIGEAAPIERHITRALMEREKEILQLKGKISTSKLTEIVSGLSGYEYSSRSIGKAARGMGFDGYSSGRERGVVIPAEWFEAQREEAEKDDDHPAGTDPAGDAATDEMDSESLDAASAGDGGIARPGRNALMSRRLTLNSLIDIGEDSDRPAEPERTGDMKEPRSADGGNSEGFDTGWIEVPEE